MSREFDVEFERLAEEARRDTAEARSESAPAERPSRIGRILAAGFVLAAIELAMLVSLHSLGRPDYPVASARVPARFASGADCKSVAYHAYRSIAAHVRDHGAPPDRLVDLVGRYADRVPADPATGIALSYRRDGSGFSLACPN